MNLTIERTLLTLFSLTVCLSIGAPLILTGMNMLDQSQEILQIETVIQQIDAEISFLIDHVDEEVEVEIYIPPSTTIRSLGNTIEFTFILQGQSEIRTLSYSSEILVEGGERTGVRELVGYTENDVVVIIIS